MNKKLIAKALQVGSRKSGNSESQRRSRKFWAAHLVLLVALAVSKTSSFADGTNLLVNGGFEQPALQCNVYVSVPEGSGFITGWNVNIPSVDNANGGCDNFPYYSHSVDLLLNPGGPRVYSGNQSIDMAGTYGAAGDSIYQDVPTQPGQTYTLTFYTSSNGDPKANGLTVEWDDVPIATISTLAQGQWSTNIFTVQASFDLSRLRFVNNIDGMQGSLVDGVSLISQADQQPPVVSCPPSITVPVGSVPPAATCVADCIAQGGSIVDNQDPNPSVTSSDQVSGSCPAVVTRTYTVTDAAGNATKCQQLITVQNHFATNGILWFPPLGRVDKSMQRAITSEFVFKYGRTIPVKIRALGCDGTNLCRNGHDNTNIIAVLDVLALSDCQDASTAQPVAIDGTTDILMQRAGGHFKYNLNTKKLPTDTQCYILKATITDTTTGESVSESLPIRSR